MVMKIESECKFVTGTKKEATEVNEYAFIKMPSLPFVRCRYFVCRAVSHIYGNGNSSNIIIDIENCSYQVNKVRKKVVLLLSHKLAKWMDCSWGNQPL